MDLCIAYALRGENDKALERLREALKREETRRIACQKGVRQLVEFSRSALVLTAMKSDPILEGWVEQQRMLQDCLNRDKGEKRVDRDRASYVVAI